jgi:hypothetical protein
LSVEHVTEADFLRQHHLLGALFDPLLHRESRFVGSHQPDALGEFPRLAFLIDLRLNRLRPRLRLAFEPRHPLAEFLAFSIERLNSALGAARLPFGRRFPASFGFRLYWLLADIIGGLQFFFGCFVEIEISILRVGLLPLF